MTRDRDGWVWAGLALVGIAAAVLSFAALADLARRCGMTGEVAVGPIRLRLAWLLPVAVDAFAVTATAIWLRRRAALEAVEYARRSAWSAIAATVVGNAYHGYLVDSSAAPPWLAVVVVSATPAVALGALVHLAVLVGRDAVDENEHGPSDAAWWRAFDDLAAEPWSAAIRAWTPAPTGADSPPPPRTASNDELAADLRTVNGRRSAAGLPALTRDEVVDRYSVGGPRARRLRTLAAVDRESDAGEDEAPTPRAVPLHGLDDPAVGGERSA